MIRIFSHLGLTALCLLAFSALASTHHKSYWLNDWDQDCYQRSVNTCREDWYQTPVGSHLILWEVFNTIEKADSSKLFSEQASISEYGFIFPYGKNRNLSNTHHKKKSKHGLKYSKEISNDFRTQHFYKQNKVRAGHKKSVLPLGFVKDKNKLDNRNYLGLTCAACHTGEVSFGNTGYIIEGGQAGADLDRFLVNLADALEKNKSDRRKLHRFKKRFAKYVLTHTDLQAEPVNPLAAIDYLTEAIDYVRAYTNRNHNVVKSGPARLDAVGAILNQLHVSHAGESESLAHPLTAPISYPYVWQVDQLECVQTNCISNNPVTRNIGAVLGAFGYVDVDENEDIDNVMELRSKQMGLNTLFDSTAKMDNLYTLEQALAKMRAPAWPSQFPPLDVNLIEHGKTLYTQHCSGCHVDTSDGVDASELTNANAIGKQFIKVKRVHYSQVGTDPAFVLDYGKRKEKSGIMGTIISGGRPFPETFNGLVLLGSAAFVIADDHFRSPEFAVTAQHAYPTLSNSQAVKSLVVDYISGQVGAVRSTFHSYRAKPLDGIAFTGPFLHNGSVRTLQDLLKKPQDRPRQFYTGSKEYDVKAGGYKNAGYFLLDTRIRGNGKEGHVYGTDLSAQDKASLLEFLKSI